MTGADFEAAPDGAGDVLGDAVKDLPDRGQHQLSTLSELTGTI